MSERRLIASSPASASRLRRSFCCPSAIGPFYQTITVTGSSLDSDGDVTHPGWRAANDDVQWM